MKTLLIISVMSTICSAITLTDNQVLNITGRMSVGNLTCLDNSIAYIYNLTGERQILGILAQDNSKVIFDVPILNFSLQDGLYGAGTLRGICFNGQSFTIDLIDSGSFSHIQNIPEPISLLFMLLGIKKACYLKR